MSFDDIDGEFKKISYRIFTKDQLKKQRLDELTFAREKDGSYKIAISNIKKKINNLVDRMNKVAQIYNRHKTYFEIVFYPKINQNECCQPSNQEYHLMKIKQEIYIFQQLTNTIH